MRKRKHCALRLVPCPPQHRISLRGDGVDPCCTMLETLTNDVEDRLSSALAYVHSVT